MSPRLFVPGSANRRKTDLHATSICGPLKQSQSVRQTFVDQAPPKTSLHLPKEVVIIGGTSLSKNSPSVIKIDRSFRYTFLEDNTIPYSSPESTRGESDGEPPRRPVPRHFTDKKAPLMQTPRGEAQSLSVDTRGSFLSFIGDDVPCLQMHVSQVASPRMQRLIDAHPKIQLDRTPTRIPCSLQRQPATLGPYRTDVLPYDPEFLWVNTDPDYKYRHAVKLSPRHKGKQPPLIPALRQHKSWSHAPLARAELQLKEREKAKKLGMDKLLEKGRRELTALLVSNLNPKPTIPKPCLNQGLSKCANQKLSCDLLCVCKSRLKSSKSTSNVHTK
jgi:hypothetical protein